MGPADPGADTARMDAITARIDVLSCAVRAIARSLSADQAQVVAAELAEAVGALVQQAGPPPAPGADDALAAEVQRLLGALAS